ncbi:hypothetical protein Tco_0438636 [Tanacetum coccineum]
MECRVRRLRRNTFISYAVTGLIPINRGLIQAIPTSLPPQPIGEATKASNLRRIPPGVQGRSHFTYFLYLIIQIRILLEEEKAQKRGKVFNCKTAKYGKICYDEDIHDLRSIETEFPAIAFNDEVSSKTLSYEPTISSLNDEIDFRISFDDSGDEDYTVIFDKNSFSYKIIFVSDLKMDSKNDNEKVNMPSFLPPEPTVSCFDDLDFFKDFENEFPVIVYNNAQTSESELLTEPILSPQHIDEFNLKDETSLSECDEEEQNVLNFNDLFPFNVIYPNDSKSDKDNDDDKVDIEHSSGDLSVKLLPDVINTDVGAYAHGSNKLLQTKYLVNISKRRAFWSLNEDILKINDSDNQYAVSITKDTAYPCLHSPKTTKETRLIRRTMAGVDVDTLTMEQYLALSRENQAPGVVKPEIRGNVNFEIKSQFMRELREDTFSGNKDEDAHDHIDRVLSIVGLFNIPGVSKDAVML